jgi:hypothetical protein
MLPSFTVLHCISNRVYFPRNINQVKMMRWKLARLEAFFFLPHHMLEIWGFGDLSIRKVQCLQV